jgi:hypothetical protein
MSTFRFDKCIRGKEQDLGKHSPVDDEQKDTAR